MTFYNRYYTMIIIITMTDTIRSRLFIEILLLLNRLYNNIIIIIYAYNSIIIALSFVD